MSSPLPSATANRLLVVHHTPSPGMQEMLEAALAGAHDEQIEGVDVVVRPALAATAVDVLEADGYLLGTPANIGYMSGALKHFFDQIYYPCLQATTKRPYGVYVHGNEGTEGAVRAITSIAGALGWEPAADPVIVMGGPDRAGLQACRELGAVLAATIMPETL
jgi:multimeric flavodoxin WrbA